MGNDFQVPRNIPLRPVGSVEKSQRKPKAGTNASVNFNDLLEQKIADSSLKFSAHAQKRLVANGIKLDESQISRLESAVAKVEAKGGRDSLVLMQNLAFVVSVTNKTVITAINYDRLQENVFTNIDSAVIS